MQPGFHVHRSNSAEALVERLARLVARPVGPPTLGECLVVAGRAVERWVTLALSQRLGIWALPDFPFPHGLVQRAFTAVLDRPESRRSAFEQGPLLWSIARLLPRLSSAREFEEIRNYLEDDEDQRKLLQLSQRIAETFDRYAVYRPELVLGWEGGRGTDWQAVLWRTLAREGGADHLAALEQAFHEALQQDTGPIDGLPLRVILFGISALPPCYVRVLAALSTRIEVHLFGISPSRAYWADIRSQREILRDHLTRGLKLESLEEALEQVVGNPLLASMGGLNRDFQLLLEANVDYSEEAADLYRLPPQDGGMLSTLQADVLALRHRHADNPDAPPLPLQPGDQSLTIHACHSPMREMEVLYDQLVSLFEADPELPAHEVVVMTPDVEAYAPLISAVFGAPTGGRTPIPYRIADRSARTTHEVFEALARLLDLLPGRMTAPQVLDLLATDIVRSRFGITATVP